MTSRVDRLTSRNALAVLAAVTLTGFLGPAGAERADAQAAPPAAVDQYQPAPPGDPTPDPDRPDRGPGDGNGSSGGPGRSATGGPGLGVAAPGGEAPVGTSGESGGAFGAHGGEDGQGAGDEGEGDASASADSGGPVIAGYPLTSALLAALLAIAVGLCAAFGVAAWRRHRDGAAIAQSS
jgi:hypothetical protein